MKSPASPGALLLRVWPPMLATPARVEDVRDSGFSFEVKYDGVRALAALSDGKLSLQSRNARDLSRRFPSIAHALLRLGVPEAVLDGEIIAISGGRSRRFDALWTAPKDLQYVVFDLLWSDGRDLRGEPLSRRRQALAKLLPRTGPVVLTRRLSGGASDALAWAQAHSQEGIIAKRSDSPYIGARSREWLKLKLHDSQEAVVVGFTRASTGADAIGALLLGVYGDTGLVYAGKVGTGFTARLRRDLYETLRAVEVREPPVRNPPRERDAHWVRPELVANVTFAEWTKDGRLRQPSFEGIRSPVGDSSGTGAGGAA